MDNPQRTSPFQLRLKANPISTNRVSKTCGLCQRSDSAFVSTLDMLNRPKDIEILEYLASKLDINFHTSIQPNLATLPFCFWCWGLYNKLFTFWVQHDPEAMNPNVRIHMAEIETVVLEFQNQKNPRQPELEEMISADKTKGQPSVTVSNSKEITEVSLPISNRNLNSKSLKTYGGKMTSTRNSSPRLLLSGPGIPIVHNYQPCGIPNAKPRVTIRNATEKSITYGVLGRKEQPGTESDEIEEIEVIRSRVSKPLNSIFIDGNRRTQNLENGTIKKAHRKKVIGLLKVNRPLSSRNKWSQQEFGNVEVVELTEQLNGLDYEKPEIEVIETVDSQSSFTEPLGCSNKSKTTAVPAVQFTWMSNGMEYEEPEIDAVEAIDPLGNLSVSSTQSSIPVEHDHHPDDMCAADDCDPLLYDLSLSDPFASMDSDNLQPQTSYYSVVAEHSYSKTVGEIKCELCGSATSAIFNSDLKLFQHIYSVHNTSHKAFTCLQCSKSFVAEVLLNRHVEFHSSDKTKPMTCDVCEERFTTDEDLAGHLFNLHSKIRDQARCLFCRKQSNNLSELRKHEMKEHYSKLAYNCTRCKERFSDRELLETHENRHSQVPFACKICKLSYNADYLLDHHLLFHLPERKPLKKDVKSVKNLSCPICDKKYWSKLHLETHVKTHTEGPYNCTVCKFNEDFSTGELLAEHLLSHPKKARIKCPECPKLFCGKNSLKNHLAKEHGHAKEYVCHLCGHAFAVKMSYDLHLKHIHPDPASVQKSWLCELCGQNFQTRARLYIHNYHHHQKRRKLKCQICKCKIFEYNLYSHMTSCHPSVPYVPRRKQTRGIERKKPFNLSALQPQISTDSPLMRLIPGGKRGEFACSVCDKVFKRRRQLTYHINTHTGEKPYKCKFCDKTFPNPMYLRGHIAVHWKDPGTERKKFPCTLCDRVFVANHLLQFHMNKHKGLKPYECRICHKKFSHPYLVGHFKFHMGNGTYVPPTSTDDSDIQEFGKD